MSKILILVFNIYFEQLDYTLSNSKDKVAQDKSEFCLLNGVQVEECFGNSCFDQAAIPYFMLIITVEP